MRAGFRRAVVIALICVFASVALSKPAKAESLQTAATQIVVAIVVIPIVLGATILYFALRAPRLTGCVVQAAEGLEILNEGDSQTYLLSGDTASLKVGDRIKVVGKKDKKSKAKLRPFTMTGLKKDYGACKVPSAAAPAGQ